MAEKDLDEVRKQKETGGVHDDIAKIEKEQLGKAAAEGLGNIEFEGDTYFKLPSGGYRGPGGNYGPTTELGKKLGQAFEARAFQRHHDYYAKLAAENKLSDVDDKEHWRVAQKREQQGLVKPWTPETPKGKSGK